MVQIKIEYFKLINHVKIFRFVCWGTNASADLQKPLIVVGRILPHRSVVVTSQYTLMFSCPFVPSSVIQAMDFVNTCPHIAELTDNKCE